MAAEAKALGNAALAKGDFDAAIAAYTKVRVVRLIIDWRAWGGGAVLLREL